MASFQMKLICLVCCMCLAWCRSPPMQEYNGPIYPGPDVGAPGTDNAPEDFVAGPDVGAPGTDNAPEDFVAGGRRLGFRCPFPPDENGRWPSYCYDVISRDCACINDDMMFSQESCVTSNRTRYEQRITSQMHLEVARGSSVDWLWECFHKIDGIVERHRTGTLWDRD